MEFCKSVLTVKEDETDKLSELPNCLIHCILNFLPIGDAVRTSVLSKRFRRCWKGTQVLKFDESFYKDFIEGKKNSLFYEVAASVISRVDGPVLEFDLNVPPSFKKDPSLKKINFPLPSFSSIKSKKSYLTKLSLSNCACCYSSMIGFENLASLSMCSMAVNEKLLKIFTCNSPKLESLILIDVYNDGNNPVTVDAPKLRTLEYRFSKYSLQLNCMPCLTSCTIDSKVKCVGGELEESYFQQFLSLMPKLKELSLGYQAVKSLVDIKVPENTQKVHIKDATHNMMISCAMSLIRSSLNLKRMNFAFEEEYLASDDMEVLLEYKESELIDEIEASYSKCLNEERYSEVLRFIREMTRTTILKKRISAHPNRLLSIQTG